MPGRRTIRCSDWRLDPSSREVTREGRRTRLAEKPFIVLMALLDARGEVVSRDDLRRQLWPDDTFVDFDNNLNTAVATLRQTLGDSARAPRYIETLPRIGYRLVMPTNVTDTVSGPRRPLAVAVGVVAATVLLAAAVFAIWPSAALVPDTAVVTSANPQAASFFARGQYLRNRVTELADRPLILTEAREAFHAAAAADPTFAAALAEEADTVVDMTFAGSVPMPDGLAEARALAERALDLNVKTAAAHRVMGMTELLLDWDFESANTYIGTAEVLQPTEARTAMARAIHASGLGDFDRAISAARRAVELDPASYFVRADLAFFYLAAGRNDEAAESSRDVLAVAPDFAPALNYAATANERLGRWPEAADAARSLMTARGADDRTLAALDTLTPREVVHHWRQWELDAATTQSAGHTDEFALELALRNAAAGNDASALDHLERAYAHRQAWLVFLRSFPEFEGLHGQPRFVRIVNGVSGAG